MIKYLQVVQGFRDEVFGKRIFAVNILTAEHNSLSIKTD